MKKPVGAKTLKGAIGNLRFVLFYKFWAAVLLFVAGLLLGFFLWGSMAVFAHPGGMAKDGCHNDNKMGNRHYHFETNINVAGLCNDDGPIVAPNREIIDRLDHIIQILEEYDSQSPEDSRVCEEYWAQYKSCKANVWETVTSCNKKLAEYEKRCE